jgi:hypothetical protein
VRFLCAGAALAQEEQRGARFSLGAGMTFFGVSVEQAARSTLPQYRAQAGFYALRFGAGGS